MFNQGGYRSVAGHNYQVLNYIWSKNWLVNAAPQIDGNSLPNLISNAASSIVEPFLYMIPYGTGVSGSGFATTNGMFGGYTPSGWYNYRITVQELLDSPSVEDISITTSWDYDIQYTDCPLTGYVTFGDTPCTWFTGKILGGTNYILKVGEISRDLVIPVESPDYMPLIAFPSAPAPKVGVIFEAPSGSVHYNIYDVELTNNIPTAVVGKYDIPQSLLYEDGSVFSIKPDNDFYFTYRSDVVSAGDEYYIGKLVVEGNKYYWSIHQILLWEV